MIQQKRFNKTYLNTARNARTEGSTTGNQHFCSKTGHIQNLSTRSTWLLGKKGEQAWDFMGFFKSDLNCIKYKATLLGFDNAVGKGRAFNSSINNLFSSQINIQSNLRNIFTDFTNKQQSDDK